MICPHCGNAYNTRYRAHIAGCPSGPAMHARYRAALEDPTMPGRVRTRDDYSGTRPSGLMSFGGLQIWARGGWGAVAARFGLVLRPSNMDAARAGQTRRNDRVADRIGAEIDADREEHLAIMEASRDVGLPVLRAWTDLRSREVHFVIR